ncbi:acyl-CoA synthetase [Microbacterium sp. P05]|uniref:acyl-CoA synthetase n=1 Tax=Microbacterium sp. P05 TaxID=3366948 RepID=UPI00374611A3
MTSAASARTFEVRHLQLARAALAAVAALMVTFSPDHSATVGLAVFSGFALATALVLALSAWLVFPRGARWPVVVLSILGFAAAFAANIPVWRSTTGFFVIVIIWAFSTGAIEVLAAVRARATAERRVDRDGLTVGVLTLVLGSALLVIRPDYALEYFIDDANRSFVLTGITIAVGVFGGYAAIVAVFLGIAGFSPRRDAVAARTEGRAAA